MNTLKSMLLLTGLASLSYAQTLPKGTDVNLRFETPVSSKTAKAGDQIKFTVMNDVTSNGTLFLKSGTPVIGIVDSVDKRGRWGKNAQIHIHINPVMWNNMPIQLDPADKGKPFSGSRTDKAAIASGAGLFVLGPVGLLAGYGFVGKPVEIHAGDTLKTEVAANVGK